MNPNDVDLLSQLLGAIHAKWVPAAGGLLALLGVLGRAFYAVRNGGGLIGIWRALLYGTNTPAPSDGKVAVNSGRVPLALAFGLIGTIGLMSGCAGVSTAAFNSEKLAADTGYAAVHTFNEYYHAETNGAAPAKLASLNSARDTVYEASKKLAASLSLAEALRTSYNTNTAAASMLQATVDDILSQMTNLVWTANYLFSGYDTNILILPSPAPAPPPPPAPAPAAVLKSALEDALSKPK